jgi:hypothetical protein
MLLEAVRRNKALASSSMVEPSRMWVGIERRSDVKEEA